jgi:hypothetical protein
MAPSRGLDFEHLGQREASEDPMTEGSWCSWIVIQRVQPRWSRFLRRKISSQRLLVKKRPGACFRLHRVKVGYGFRLAFPTGAYYTWNGTALDGSPIEPDVAGDFSWQERRNGVDGQLQKALELIAGLKSI